jgi:hypothetical protein
MRIVRRYLAGNHIRLSFNRCTNPFALLPSSDHERTTRHLLETRKNTRSSSVGFFWQVSCTLYPGIFLANDHAPVKCA